MKSGTPDEKEGKSRRERERREGGYRRAGMVAERPLRRRWMAAVAIRQLKTCGRSRGHETGGATALVSHIGFLKTKTNSKTGKSIVSFTMVEIFLKKNPMK